MHRLLVKTELLNEASPTLPRDAAKHLKVLRPKDGEEIELFDGKGKWRVYRFCASLRSGQESASPLVATSQTFQTSQTSQTFQALTLFACVTKGSRWDWTIEKATELGVGRIVPVISDRTIVRIPMAERAAKRERWLRIAEDAARQSDAKWLPEILEAVDFADALPLVRETACFIGALTNPPSRPLALAVRDEVEKRGGGGQRTDRVPLSVFIGPEGDFTPDELKTLMDIATPTSFGPTILRAETAAIFAVSVLASMRGCLRGREKQIADNTILCA